MTPLEQVGKFSADSQETPKNMDLVATENILRVLNGQEPLYDSDFPFS